MTQFSVQQYFDTVQYLTSCQERPDHTDSVGRTVANRNTQPPKEKRDAIEWSGVKTNQMERTTHYVDPCLLDTSFGCWPPDVESSMLWLRCFSALAYAS